MTFKAIIEVDDLTAALKGLREEGFLAKQSPESPDVVFVYGKDKGDLVEAAKKYYKTRGYENVVFEDDFYKNTVQSGKVDDAELLSAVKEPEHKEVSILENKTENDLYDERHPLDKGGVKHAVDDEDLLKKVKTGDDFKVELDDIKADDEAVKVTEAQTQRGGSGNPGEREEAEDKEKDLKPSSEGADVVAKAVQVDNTVEQKTK